MRTTFYTIARRQKKSVVMIRFLKRRLKSGIWRLGFPRNTSSGVGVETVLNSWAQKRIIVLTQRPSLQFWERFMQIHLRSNISKWTTVCFRTESTDQKSDISTIIKRLENCKDLHPTVCQRKTNKAICLGLKWCLDGNKTNIPSKSRETEKCVCGFP